MSHNQLEVVKVTKVDLINQLSKFSCDGSFLEKKEKKRKPVKVMSTKRLTEDALLKQKYPKQVLGIALCEYVWPQRVKEWR